MNGNAPTGAGPIGSGGILGALIGREGSATHPYLIELTRARAATRDIADAVHLLCVLHCRQPGIVDIALDAPGHEFCPDWLEHGIAGFADERTYLTHLVVEAGPLPSTPGQAESEAAVLGQRHALEMLAGSERRGCAIGAAIALVQDWVAVRVLLDMAAHRFGIDAPPCTLPPSTPTAALAARLTAEGSMERAMMFGAQQLLLQHRGLWSLLESRRVARDA